MENLLERLPPCNLLLADAFRFSSDQLHASCELGCEESHHYDLLYSLVHHRVLRARSSSVLSIGNLRSRNQSESFSLSTIAIGDACALDLLESLIERKLGSMVANITHRVLLSCNQLVEVGARGLAELVQLSLDLKCLKLLLSRRLRSGARGLVLSSTALLLLLRLGGDGSALAELLSVAALVVLLIPANSSSSSQGTSASQTSLVRSWGELITSHKTANIVVSELSDSLGFQVQL